MDLSDYRADFSNPDVLRMIEVPYAEQVIKEGVDAVKHNALPLENIEKLTLYSIQLEKINQRL